MRRNLEVGMAYGSDIEKVNTTLLEIARETKAVLKYPQPDVLFIDHADSALIFRMRVWLRVDDYRATVSQIRTEIERHFREQGIEIAFPQRDVHIRTITGGCRRRQLPERIEGTGRCLARRYGIPIRQIHHKCPYFGSKGKLEIN